MLNKNMRMSKGYRDAVTLKDELLESLKYPIYQCNRIGCGFKTESKKEMIQHYVNKHGLPLRDFPNEHPYDFEHIILSYLVQCFEFKGGTGKYIKVSNMILWSNLCSQLHIKKSDKDAPSKGKPRHILNQLGLLTRGIREKKRMGYNSKGNRVYYINIKDLERAVNNTDFYDLQIKLGLLDSLIDDEVFIESVTEDKTTSSPSESNHQEADNTGDTGGFGHCDEDWEI
jgi:hypothetical protein